MMAHETFGFWFFFAVFSKLGTVNLWEPKVTVVKLSTPTSSDESFAAWIVDPCEGFLRKVSVGQERYWNMNKWRINGSSETWNFLLWKKFLLSQRISALGFSTFLHVSPWRLRFFNSPLQGIMNRVLPLQRGIQKSLGKLVQISQLMSDQRRHDVFHMVYLRTYTVSCTIHIYFIELQLVYGWCCDDVLYLHERIEWISCWFSWTRSFENPSCTRLLHFERKESSLYTAMPRENRVISGDANENKKCILVNSIFKCRMKQHPHRIVGLHQ